MRWINGISALAVALVSLSIYANQALWRVENAEQGQALPEAASYVSPFPQEQAPPPRQPRVVTPVKPVVNPEEKLRRDRARQASQLLSDVRYLMSNEELLEPQLQGVVISAYAVGPQGPQVLIDNSWQRAGEVLEVPVTRTADVVDLLSRLRDFDPALVEQVEDELSAIADLSTQLELHIRQVTREHVELVENNGKVHLIPVGVQDGF